MLVLLTSYIWFSASVLQPSARVFGFTWTWGKHSAWPGWFHSVILIPHAIPLAAAFPFFLQSGPGTQEARVRAWVCCLGNRAVEIVWEAGSSHLSEPSHP